MWNPPQSGENKGRNTNSIFEKPKKPKNPKKSKNPKNPSEEIGRKK